MLSQDLRVILVEDNPGDVRLTEVALADPSLPAQVKLQPVTRLKQALKLIEEEEWDVVLSDLSLPDSHGIKTVARLREAAPDIPVVVLTSLGDEETALEALHEGAQDYLVKGHYDGEVLVRSLQYAIERHRMRTELEGQSEDLRLREEALRNLVEHNADGIVIVDADGTVQYANPAAEVLFDRDRRKWIGQPFEYDVVPGEAAEITVQTDTIRVLEMRGAETLWQGQEAYLASLRDITSRKEIEEERKLAIDKFRELDRMKTRFINTAAHELMTPFTPIMFQMHLLRSTDVGELNEEQLEAVDMLERNLERLHYLVQDLLDASRHQAGKLKLNMEEVDLCKLADEAVRSFGSNQARIRLEAPDQAIIEADRNRIMQVFNNLLKNAVKFTHDEGHIEVRVALEDSHASVVVRDNGIGMTADQLESIFNPFTQVHDTMQQTEAGTGLGLYICKGIIEQHGGAVWAESEGPDRGSSFSFTLPLQQLEAEAPAASPA